MKRIIVLAIVGLFVASFAMAQDATVTAEVESRWLQDFNNKTFSDGHIVELEFSATVDDNNELYIEIEEGPDGTSTDYYGFPFDRAYFTTDLGGLFDLPIGLTVRSGYDEYKLFDAAKVTVGEYEDIIGSDAKEWGHRIEISANDMVTLRTAFATDPGKEVFMVGVAVDYAPIYFEAGYYSALEDEDAAVVAAGDAISSGSVEVGVEYAGDDIAPGIDLGVAGTFEYDLVDAFDDAYYEFGAGVAATYNDMATLGIALRGETDYPAAAVQIDVSAAPVEGLEIFLIAGVGLDEESDFAGADAFDSFEGSLMWNFGASTWYAGMMWIAENGVGIASEKSDFGPEAADTMGVFMRAELKY